VKHLAAEAANLEQEEKVRKKQSTEGAGKKGARGARATRSAGKRKADGDGREKESRFAGFGFLLSYVLIVGLRKRKRT
jgi:hypothetical protein